MKATVYTKPACGYCTQSKMLLDMHGIGYTEFDIQVNAEHKQTLLAECAKIDVVPRTVPQIWIGDLYIGGYDQLREYIDAKQLT